MLWREVEIVGVLIAATMLLVLFGWAFVAAVRELGFGYREALRRPRFDLLDLLLLVTVLGASLAAVRWYWDSIYVGIALLLVPMLAPLPWIGKFLYQDVRLAREKRRQQRETVVEFFEMPSEETLPKPIGRRRLSIRPTKTWIPPLTPLSLSARPLQDDD
jgi:hypothetical protein